MQKAITNECPCKRKNCERHGKCEECMEHHKTHKREPYCVRKGIPVNRKDG
jgi:hypothetical protein